MGHSRDAARLQELVGSPVKAAVVVDRPRGFVRAKGNRLSVESGLGAVGPPRFVTEYERSLEAHTREPNIDASLVSGVYLGVTADSLIVAKRGLMGRAAALIRSDPLHRIRLGWLDHQMHEMHSRYLHVEFPDSCWSLLSTAWRRLVPDDVHTIVGALGANAYRLSALASRRDASGA